MKLWEPYYREQFEKLQRNRRAETVVALKEIIKEMHEDGYSASKIGRLMHKDHTTILHHLWEMGYDYRKDWWRRAAEKRKIANDLREQRVKLRAAMNEEKIREQLSMDRMREVREAEKAIKLESAKRWHGRRERAAQRKKAAIEMYQEGIPLLEIADKLGVSESSIAGYVRTSEDFRKYIRRPRKGVIQMDMNGKEIQRFPTIVSASAGTGIARATISKCITGRDLTAGGFKWARAKHA